MANQKSPWALAAKYANLAVLLPASTAVGYLIGYGLDRLFHTAFLKIIFLLLGTAAGFIQLIRQVQKDTGSNGE